MYVHKCRTLRPDGSTHTCRLHERWLFQELWKGGGEKQTKLQLEWDKNKVSKFDCQRLMFGKSLDFQPFLHASDISHLHGLASIMPVCHGVFQGNKYWIRKSCEALANPTWLNITLRVSRDRINVGLRHYHQLPPPLPTPQHCQSSKWQAGGVSNLCMCAY